MIKKWYMLMVPGLLALAACTADTDDGVTHSGIPVTLTQTTVATDTRAAGNLNNNYITSGEHILVKITDAASRTLDYFYTAGDEGALAPKLGCVEAYYPSSGNVDIAAWYPWTTTDPFFVSDDQTTDADYMASDLMFAMAKGKNRNSGEVPLEFYHKMAKLNVTVTPGSDLSDVTELRLKSVQRGVTANLLTGAVAVTIGDTYPADDIVMSTSNHGSVVFPPQVLDGEFLEVTTDEGTAVFALDAPKEFKAGHEYTLEIQMTNMSVGAATVIEGWGDNGTLAVYINRSQYELYIDAIPDMPWSGSAILPQPDVTYNGEVLTLGTDYVLEYIDNVNLGKATIVARGKGIYGSKASARLFSIVKATPVITLSEEGDVIVKAPMQRTVTAVTIDNSRYDGVADIDITAQSTVTYESSNTAIATVAADGSVIPQNPGTCTITVRSSAGATWEQGETSYEITVQNTDVDNSNAVDPWTNGGTTNGGDVNAYPTNPSRKLKP
ncbi:MAG: fimbrillin family protein [Prevotella sp.]|nr:fimbrillin family protein [Prevotella sp.]